MKKTIIIILITLILFLSFPIKESNASCETSMGVYGAFYKLATIDVTNDLQSYSKQEKNFYAKSASTARYMIFRRLDEFRVNVLLWFQDWWNSKMLPSLRDMNQQVSTSIIVQSMNIGKMIDAQILNEEITSRQERKNEAVGRYEPSPLSCQVDTIGPGKTRTYQSSRALANSIAAEAALIRGNTKGTAAAISTDYALNELWDEYTEYFCDEEQGDVGCKEDIDPVLKSKHKDLSNLLWGDKQTIDLSTEDNERLITAAVRYLIYPKTPSPMPKSIENKSSFKEEVLLRRSEIARTNVIYHTIGQIIGERMGGSNIDIQDIRTDAGISIEDASTNASYRELQEAMGRDRFYSKKYITNLAGTPEQIIREQITIGATRLQLINDIFRRQEELLLLTATDYSRGLDRNMPGTATDAAGIQ